MLEKLPDLVGHALRGQRAGLDKIAFQAVDLRGGMAALAVSSLAFADHAPMPERYTADGEGVSPPLQWTGVPAAAASLLLIVEDADSPTPQPLVHAIVVGLPAATAPLPEAALPSRDNDGAGLPDRAQLLSAGELAAARPAAGPWRPPLCLPGVRARGGADFDGEPGREAVLEAIRDHGAGERLPDRHLRAPRYLDHGRRRGRRAGDPAGDARDLNGAAGSAARSEEGGRGLVEQIVDAVAAGVLDRQQATLGGAAARRGKAAEFAAGSDDPVAGNDHRK